MGEAVWDCDAEHAMTASVRTAAAAAAAELRQCTCRCLACASAGPHPNPRSNATCCFRSTELGGTGKPATADELTSPEYWVTFRNKEKEKEGKKICEKREM